MVRQIPKAIRVAITLIVVMIAILAVLLKFYQYLAYPWTRDGQVRAQVIQITSRVSGPIIELLIKDNQIVKKNDLLWKIDPRTFQAKLNRAQAALRKAKVARDEAKDIAGRARRLYQSNTGAISEQKLVELENHYRGSIAAVHESEASLHSAKLDLEFTVMRSPVGGYITNLKIHTGSHVVADKPVLALVDTQTFWVHAFFKETLMKYIKPGDKAIVKLMSYPDKPIEGVVNSVGWGVAQQDGSTGPDLLPNINPTFDWIRLAQRIPVRIHLIKIPKGIHLRVGTTATIIVLHKK